MNDALLRALRRILRPLARLAIRRGLSYGAMAEALKQAMVAEAAASLRGEKITDSRLSLMTGLQRRDVKRLRDLPDDPAPTFGPAPRVVLRWRSGPDWTDSDGPRPLPRRGATGFEGLAASVSQDIHPRAVLDTLIADGMAEWDVEADTVRLLREDYVPADEGARLDYLGHNIGDHTLAAVGNLLSDPPPFFERAAHFNRLDTYGLIEMDRTARDIQSFALSKLAERATKLQKDGATGRFRCGAFVFTEQEDTAT